MKNLTETDRPEDATCPSSAPPAPMRLRDLPRLRDMLWVFSGWIDDPGARYFRGASGAYRLPFPRLPQPLKAFVVDCFLDDCAGEVAIITSPQLIRELYNLPNGQIDYEAWKKALIYVLGAQSPFLLRGRDHTRVRRAIAAELTPAQVETYRERSVERLDSMIDELPLNTPVPLHEFYTRFTQDIILRVVFGWDCPDLKELAEELYESSKHYAAPRGVRLIPYMAIAPFVLRKRENPADLSTRNDMPPRWFARHAYRLRTRTDALIDHKIAHLRLQPNDSVASRIIDYGSHETPSWTDKRLRDIIRTMLVAGHDTSVLAYSWATQYLLHNRDAREKVIAESRAGVTDRYTQAANTEALRMSPPVTALVPYPAAQDIVIGGKRIHKNTMIYAPATALHMNPDVFTQPEKFLPERWLDSATKPDRYQFVPFGAGPHRCPGSTFYLTEASILLHRLFGRLELRPCLPHVDEARFIYGTLSRPKGDTEVIITNRRPATDVPWYRPTLSETLSPLKQALLPDDDPEHQESRCPVNASRPHAVSPSGMEN